MSSQLAVSTSSNNSGVGKKAGIDSFVSLKGGTPRASGVYEPAFLTSKDFKATNSNNSSQKDMERPSSADIFKAAGRDVMVRNSMSGAFKTLRDMTGADDYLEFSDLKKVRVLGQGAFAVVDEMVNAAGARYAVKKLKPQLQTSDLHDFVQETGLLKRLKNPNIVEFRGTGQYGPNANELFIAQECMDGGSLKNILYNQGINPSKLLYSRIDALRWAVQMARGLQYLHEAKPMVIHRDLKLENILLDNKDAKKANAKIADFGLHKVINQGLRKREEASGGVDVGELGMSIKRVKMKIEDTTYQMTGETGSLMYMAPEVLLGKAYNEKVDMFSFGVMFFEMLDYTMMVGKVSVGGDPEELHNYASRVAEGFRPGIPAHWPPAIGAVIEKCWNQDIQLRPSFAEVIPMLQGLEGDIVAMDAKLKSDAACCVVM